MIRTGYKFFRKTICRTKIQETWVLTNIAFELSFIKKDATVVYSVFYQLLDCFLNQGDLEQQIKFTRQRKLQSLGGLENEFV